MFCSEWPLELMEHATRRAPATGPVMRGLALLAAVAAVGLFLSCGGDDTGVHPSVTASQTATPTPAYTASKPTGSPEAFSVTPSPPPFIDHSVRACTSDDLIAVFGHINGATMGQLLTYIDFANRSATVCRLEGRPGIDMLDAPGSPAALTRSDFCFSAPCVVQSAILSPNVTQIKTGEPTPGTASIALYWPTYLVEGPPCQPPALKVTVVRVSLPEGGGTIDVPVKDPLTGATQIEPCTRIGVGVFVGTPATLWPADSEAPAAGVCGGPPAGGVVHFDINVDVPAPRCSVVRPDQALELTNKTGEAIGIQLADVYESLIPGATTTLFTASFGSYLALGVHVVHVSYYHGSGPEIWIVTPTETPGG
jgi:hypothetical protein